jgi:hypothetical protein
LYFSFVICYVVYSGSFVRKNGFYFSAMKYEKCWYKTWIGNKSVNQGAFRGSFKGIRSTVVSVLDWYCTRKVLGSKLCSIFSELSLERFSPISTISWRNGDFNNDLPDGESMKRNVPQRRRSDG